MTAHRQSDGRSKAAAAGPAAAEQAGEADKGEARLRELERENTRLRRIVADRDLEIEMLREISRGTY